MQTIEQFLSKTLDLIEDANQRGEKPDLIFLTPDDEHTLAVHAWLRAKDGDKPDALHKEPPSVRGGRSGYTEIAGLAIQWNAEKTEVRARTPDEQKAHQEKMQKSLQTMIEVNQQAANAARQRRSRFWG
jgi:hypothetical protein